MANQGTTVATVLVVDQGGRAVALAPVSLSVNSKQVSWQGCKTDGFGKVVLTWPTEPSPYLCVYSVGQPAQTGQIRLAKGQHHDIRIQLRSKVKASNALERKFRLVERKTVRTQSPFDGPPIYTSVDVYEAGGVGVAASRVLDALMVDERTGDAHATFIEDDGLPFFVAATTWETAHCLPLGKTKFVPVVNTAGVLVGWYHPLVSPDDLFLVVPPEFLELFPDQFPKDEGTPPASLTVYDPKGSVEDVFFRFSQKQLGFPSESGGVKFAVLFDINGNVLSVTLSSIGSGGRGDPLFDKVLFVLSLGHLIKGLIVGLTKAGLKALMRPASRKLDDAVFLGSAHKGQMSVEYATKIGGDVFSKSRWLSELKRINGIKDLDKQYKEIAKFIDDYKAATGISIKVVPREMAKSHGLRGGNWGTYAEKEKAIYMHEEVWTNPAVNTVRELGHEVGVAELGRIAGISKSQVPMVTPIEGRIRRWYLTHVIDLHLR